MAVGRKKQKATTEPSLGQVISQVLSKSASPAEALGKAADLLAEQTRAEAVQIGAALAENDRIVEIYSSGKLSSLFPSGLRRPSHGSSMRTITNRGLISLTLSDLQFGSQHGIEDFSIFMAADYRYLIAAPVSIHGEHLGSVQLLSSAPMSDNALRTLEEAVPLLAPYVALFLANMDSAAGNRISHSIERVAEAVIHENGLEGVCKAIVKFAKGSMGIDAVIVRVLDAENNALRIEYQHGHLDMNEIVGDGFDVVEKRLIPMAIERKGPVIIDEGSPEVFNDPEFTSLMEEVPSMLIAPLLDRSELLGTIEFYSLNEYAYKSEHLRNVEYVANLLTSAVAHYRLIRSLSREAEIRGLLAEVARLASAASDLASLVTSISPELQRVIPVDYVTYCMPPERVNLAQIESLVMTTGCDELDPLVRIKVTGPEHEKSHNAGECGASHCLTAMLWEAAEERPQGWIHLERADSPFTNEEQKLIYEFARHISPAIDTALSHEAELQLANEQLRAERAEAEVKQQLELNQAKQNFIATMSHELRTPLTSIRAFTDLLNRKSGDPLTERQRKQLSVVRRNTEWLNILINDLLDLSSIDSGRFELQYQDVDITTQLQSLMESFSPIAEMAEHKLHIILPKRTINMQIDPNRINQVFGNLLTNAMKYSPEGTSIRLLAKPSNGGVAFFVRDEGPGIPYDQQSTVFERFVRANSEASRKARGTGIGLYVSKTIVENHGGFIGLKSVPDDHTTMYFWIPGERPDRASVSSDNVPQDARRHAA